MTFKDFHPVAHLTMEQLEKKYAMYNKTEISLTDRYDKHLIDLLFELWLNPEIFDSFPSEAFEDKTYIKTAIQVVKDRFKEELRSIIKDYQKGENK